MPRLGGQSLSPGKPRSRKPGTVPSGEKPALYHLGSEPRGLGELNSSSRGGNFSESLLRVPLPRPPQTEAERSGCEDPPNLKHKPPEDKRFKLKHVIKHHG